MMGTHERVSDFPHITKPVSDCTLPREVGPGPLPPLRLVPRFDPPPSFARDCPDCGGWYEHTENCPTRVGAELRAKAGKRLPLVLGLVGPSGGGKTTVCDHLREAHGFVQFHVAEPIKRGFQAMFGLGPEYCERPLIEQPLYVLGSATPRQVLEHIGTELHAVAPLAVPQFAAERIDFLRAKGSDRIIVDGLRRVTEAHAVRKAGGHIIRIAGRPIDGTKPCDLSQAEVVEDFAVEFGAIDALHHQIDGIIARLTREAA